MLSVILLAAAGRPPVVTDGRLRVLLPTIPAAGYFTLVNPAPTPLVLTGATSPSCASIMLHMSAERGGLSTMTMTPSVAVPPGGTLRFAPGGHHLMCLSPSATPGGTATVTLDFADGEHVAVPFRVVGARG